MSDYVECPTCKEFGDLADHMLEATKRVQEKYDELIRELLYALDEYGDENSTRDLDQAIHNMKNWLGWYDERDMALLEWSARKV